MAGNDRISGGRGQDYLEGADGDDLLVGGDGNDIASGGDDNDRIRGGAGDDVAYAGRGTDTTYGGSGDDRAHSESGDTDEDVEQHVTVQIAEVPEWIKIEGSPEFVARTRADLEMLAASPTGRQMFENYQWNRDNSGFAGIGKEGLTIKEATDANGYASDGQFGGNEISYNPGFDNLRSNGDAPPIAILYHEMAHVYDYMNGTFRDDIYDGTDDEDRNDSGNPDFDIKVGERQAAGLPIDHDNDPTTPEIVDPEHPLEYTENGLREEIGWREAALQLGGPLACPSLLWSRCPRRAVDPAKPRRRRCRTRPSMLRLRTRRMQSPSTTHSRTTLLNRCWC